MTSFSTKPYIAPLFLIALLLSSASIPPPVHGQLTSLLPISPAGIIPLISNLLPIFGGGNLLPQLNIIGLITRILGSLLPVSLNVVGQLTCPGQPGSGLGGLPVNLTCVTNGLRVFGGQTVTNRNGSFAVNTTLSPLQAVGIVSNLLSNNTLGCIVSTPQQVVQSVVQCPALTNATGGIVSLVQFTGTNIFSVFRRVLSANATGSAVV